jgi:hypothetical protein
MKHHLNFWLILSLIFVGLLAGPRPVQAKIPIKPNVSAHIYQDRSFFNQNQINHLEQQANQLAQTKQGQTVKIFIIHQSQLGDGYASYLSDSDVNDSGNPAGMIQNSIVQHQTTGTDGEYLGSSVKNDVEKHQTILVFIPEKDNLSFASSSFTSNYYNKRTWRKITFWNKHLLNDSQPAQARGVYRIATKLNRQQLKLSQQAKPPKEAWDLGTVGDWLTAMIIFGGPLLIIWAIIRFGYIPLGGGGGDADYTDGYFDGWISHDIYGDWYDDRHDDF